ncbi:unnamed protein product [Sphenostylis stenocarpa]|uniref:AT-hook motif nuclear-localized protein n=1 Tax=Sphenostylis stenocarpa TaxID=92480 RepID=A0AA86S623_9FABA|nr:unnamed protein product [Sphenostylis stenocarpa]
MDAREPPRPPPPSIMAGPTAYAPNNIGPNSSAAIMMAPATARFPFGVVQPPQQQPPPAEPFPLSPAAAYDGSSSPMKPCSLAKKKRGRPRKYSPDGNIALGLAPTHVSPPPPSGAVSGSGIGGDSAGTASEPPAKKHRGRPPGSGKKQLDALGAGGVGFTPHVILVESGEVIPNKKLVLPKMQCSVLDITAKIMAFSQQGPRTVCILSAIGAICNVTLRQPALSGGTATYERNKDTDKVVWPFRAKDLTELERLISVAFKAFLWCDLLDQMVRIFLLFPQARALEGVCPNTEDGTSVGRFEIISLSGAMQQSESNGERSRTCTLNVTLAGSDGRVLGGGVAGTLTAASTVQVIVGSFIVDAKKSSSNVLKSGPSAAPPPQMLTFGAPMTPTSPTSQGPSTESSEEHDHTPFCRGPGSGPGPGLYNNTSQPVHNMPIGLFTPNMSHSLKPSSLLHHTLNFPVPSQLVHSQTNTSTRHSPNVTPQPLPRHQIKR